MMFSLSKSFTILSLASSVLAHGYISQINVDNKPFKGPDVSAGDKNADSVIRAVDSIEPTKGADNPDINCGPNSQKSNLVAQAKPGSDIDVFWMAGGGENWPHDLGPMLTYLASCDGNCTEFDSTKAKWFKISEVGLKADGTTWFQKDLMSGKPDSFKLPSNLAAGGYLLRHEIIALHLADKKGGAEFYPGCAQIEVSGSATGAPKENELVSFPGAYSDGDKGIFINVFNGKINNYPFPGPQISSLAATSSDGTASSSSSSSASSGKPSATTTGSSSQSSGTTSGSTSSSKSSKCSLKKSESSPYKKKRHYPRQISRIMRDLATAKLAH
ncbi:glycoside hydrolase family 61 protein [Flagelloscypha sp. PMI_526]|nr:glycoside hydrolase family 61 protein [Flagelloscypha sp. PMI_526]